MYIQRLVAATRAVSIRTPTGTYNSPSELVEPRRRPRRLAARDHLLGAASPRSGALLVSQNGPRSTRRTSRDLAVYVLGHRLWLGPHAASHGLTTDSVIADVIERGGGSINLKT